MTVTTNNRDITERHCSTMRTLDRQESRCHDIERRVKNQATAAITGGVVLGSLFTMYTIVVILHWALR